MAGRLAGKVCLITGGASGIGGVASRVFARQGAKMAIADLNRDAGYKTVDEIRDLGGEAHFIQADVAAEEDCRRMVEEAVGTFGHLSILYNNAGIFPPEDRSVIDTDAVTWERVLRVNLMGLTWSCKYGIPALLEAGGGSVINIASFTALLGCTVPQDAYTASKGGVISLSRSLAVQFGPKGVRTNVICPGPIETPMIMSWLLNNPEEKRKRLVRIPLGRLGRPEDVAHLALYLASDESAWTNGAVMVVDGGITANYF